VSLQVLDILQVDELESTSQVSYPMTDRRWVLLSQPFKYAKAKETLIPCNLPLFIPRGAFMLLPISSRGYGLTWTYALGQYLFDNRKLAQQGPDW
jgi:hypothetical protein